MKWSGFPPDDYYDDTEPVRGTPKRYAGPRRVYFEAQFAGTCPVCQGEIGVGHSLTWDDDHQAIHAYCRERELSPAMVCTNCFQAMSVTGKCGCDD